MLRMHNMEQFHVISLLGADARLFSHTSDLAEARQNLNRNTLRLHMRHVLAWSARCVLVLGLFLLGRYAMESAIGGAIAWTSGFLGIYLFLYAARGHLKIQNDRQAKLYWLENDAANREFSSDDPIIATMPPQENYEPAHCYGNAAS